MEDELAASKGEQGDAVNAATVALTAQLAKKEKVRSYLTPQIIAALLSW